MSKPLLRMIKQNQQAHSLIFLSLSNNTRGPDKDGKAIILIVMLRRLVKTTFMRRMFFSSVSPGSLYEHCQQLYRQGKYQDALNALEKLLDQERDNAVVHQLKADILVALGRLQEARNVYTKILALNPVDAESYYKKGTLSRKMGLLKEALKEFSEAIGINPQLRQALDEKNETEAELDSLDSSRRDPEVIKKEHLERAKEFAHRGDIKAFDEVNLALQIDSKFIEALNYRATLYYSTNQISNALKDWNSIIEIDPQQADAWRSIAIIHGFQLDDQQTAEFHLVEGLKNNPKHIMLLRLFAEFIGDKNRSDLLSKFEQLSFGVVNKELFLLKVEMYRNLRIQDKVIGEVKELLKIADSVQDYILCGELLEQISPQEAKECYEAASKLNPTDPAVIWKLAQAKLDSVDMSSPHRREALEDHLQTMDNAIAKHPSHFFLYLARGNRRIEARLYDGALEDADKGLTLGPKNKHLLICKARALEAKGLNTESLKSLDQAIEIDPSFQRSLLHRGSLLLKMGRSADALLDFQNASLQPGNKRFAQMKKAQCLQQLGRTSEALPIFEKHQLYTNVARIHLWNLDYKKALTFSELAIKGNENDTSALIIKAGCLANHHQVAESMQLFDKVLSISPELEEATFLKGCLLILIGKYKEAGLLFQSNLKNNQDHKWSQNSLALTHMLLHDYEAALKQINKAIQIDPEEVDYYIIKTTICLLKNEVELASTQLDNLRKKLQMRPNKLSDVLTYTLQQHCLMKLLALSELAIGKPEGVETMKKFYLRFLEIFTVFPTVQIIEGFMKELQQCIDIFVQPNSKESPPQ